MSQGVFPGAGKVPWAVTWPRLCCCPGHPSEGWESMGHLLGLALPSAWHNITAGRCKPAVAEGWRGCRAVQGRGGTQVVSLGGGFCPQELCPCRAPGVGWKQLWHLGTPDLSDGAEFAGTSVWSPAHVFVVIATFVGKAKLSCLVWVKPCKPQIVHEIHGEKQFKILCSSVFCVLETVKPFHAVTGG